MKFKEYVNGARSTAIYPFMDEQDGLDYALTGLAGELGEMFNVIQKMMRDDRWDVTEAKVEKLSQEAGGTCWYISQAYKELKIDDEEIEESYVCDIHDIFYEEHAEDISEYIKKYGQLKAFRKLMTESLAFAMSLLDDFDAAEANDDVYGVEMLKEMGDLLYLCFSSFSAAIGILDIDLGNVCKDNLALLAARKEAGTIKGSGDGVKGRS